MTKEEIISLAWKAMLIEAVETTTQFDGVGSINVEFVAPRCALDCLERFADLVIDSEREACAQLMEGQHIWITNISAGALIRARSAA